MRLWIARDPDGSLWMYDDEPILGKFGWMVKPKSNGETKPAKQLHSWYLSEVTFENSPQQVEFNLIKK